MASARTKMLQEQTNEIILHLVADPKVGDKRWGGRCGVPAMGTASEKVGDEAS